LTTASTTLRFIQANQGPLESGMLENVHLTSDPRSNSLIVVAPTKTMDLILALIHDLDVVAATRATVNVFTLKRANAVLTSNLLQQLFLGTTAAGGPGVPGPGAAGATAITRPFVPVLLDQPADGASLINLRVTVDERTNSVIVAGSQNDLLVINSIITRLESEPTPERTTMVFKLRNAAAADVASTLQTYYNQTLGAYTTQLTSFEQVQREVIITPDAVSNSLLVNATPPYFPELQAVVDRLDAAPPQVMIQVLIAQVDVNTDEEMGVEWGGQSPILFQRSILANGTTVNNSQADPGFGFNGPSFSNGATAVNAIGGLPANTIASPGLVAFQGLNNFGLGRQSASQGIGGLVLSVSSDAVTVLIRALKTQGRLDILSRPQVMTTDNQSATIQVGQDFPVITSTTVVAGGLTTTPVSYRPVGVILNITPRISADPSSGCPGRVIMRVTPEVSSVDPTPVPLGAGLIGTAFNVQNVDTTVAVDDGETVILGGLITKRDNRIEKKVPILGDLPGVGALFRFRTRTVLKSELMFIMTPHIIRSQADADRIIAQETVKMNWIMQDVAAIHTHGVEKFSPPGGTVPAGLLDPNLVLPPAQPMPPVQPGTKANPKGAPAANNVSANTPVTAPSNPGSAVQPAQAGPAEMPDAK
jgi:type II secretion system protein D